jgi:hypothetical protein
VRFNTNVIKAKTVLLYTGKQVDILLLVKGNDVLSKTDVANQVRF